MVEPLGFEAVRAALAEDHVREDVTTNLLGSRADAEASASFVVEEPCTIAGLPVAAEVFRQLGVREALAPQVEEGTDVPAGDLVAEVHGSARLLLAGERAALNFLQRLSAIATATRAAVQAVEGTGAIITDTRKTTPGLRELEKYAVRMGGGENHRAHLGDGVLWKDNHWALLGRSSFGKALAGVPAGMTVVVEAETEEQFAAALEAGVTRILVDNLPPKTVAKWVRRAGKDIAIEASGGIGLENVRAYAEAGVRYISMGALTHSVRAIKIRMEIEGLTA